MTWNINGLTNLNRDLRLNVIYDTNADIVALNETHQGPADNFSVIITV